MNFLIAILFLFQHQDNIIIGDSQVPYLSNATTKAKLQPGLWKSGISVYQLKKFVDSYKTDSLVKNVFIVIGTNSAFNPNENINGLVSSLHSKFSKANLYVVQGSWGWEWDLMNITPEKLKRYYGQFESNGVKVIDPPIGNCKNPHGNLPIYKVIGKQIDSLVRL